MKVVLGSVHRVVQEKAEMGWEQRGSKCYYYRVRREGDRVIKQYFKPGAAADAAAQADILRRAAVDIGKKYARRLQDAMRPLDALLDRVDESVDQLMSTVLTQNGFYKHHGSWRIYARKQDHHPET